MNKIPDKLFKSSANAMADYKRMTRQSYTYCVTLSLNSNHLAANADCYIVM